MTRAAMTAHHSIAAIPSVRYTPFDSDAALPARSSVPVAWVSCTLPVGVS